MATTVFFSLFPQSATWQRVSCACCDVRLRYFSQVGSVRIDLPPAAEFEEADPFDNRQPNHSNLEL